MTGWGMGEGLKSGFGGRGRMEDGFDTRGMDDGRVLGFGRWGWVGGGEG